jgi:hypothetical protein
MKYLEKTFSTPANSEKYRDNWEKVFGNPEKDFEVEKLDNVDFEVSQSCGDKQQCQK